MEKGDTSLQFS
ncbi:unnamed protein product [Linum tenue]|uniref:Uncharacterized protein n=1 Tax=Linum tenue TaxID=586396 RepID=A0AAV0R2K1_9ROSI|nr:unnamed protein product [Linum tenue]